MTRMVVTLVDHVVAATSPILLVVGRSRPTSAKRLQWAFLACATLFLAVIIFEECESAAPLLHLLPINFATFVP
ncbi:unnamed protein product [Toxocara canis]|uniref:Uncharacterized protein n=1 Tax=Toxocara canis TaxID=6265 RepID=A0A183V9T1_TOXCA|nr:unnamed protein product [Toxocara canis]